MTIVRRHTTKVGFSNNQNEPVMVFQVFSNVCSKKVAKDRLKIRNDDDGNDEQKK
jgi:hypothetical protein